MADVDDDKFAAAGGLYLFDIDRQSFDTIVKTFEGTGTVVADRDDRTADAKLGDASFEEDGAQSGLDDTLYVSGRAPAAVPACENHRCSQKLPGCFSCLVGFAKASRRTRSMNDLRFASKTR